MSSVQKAPRSTRTHLPRPCKNRKIKCGEERPSCQNCERQGEACDYSIRLNWEGRTKRKGSNENHTSTTTLSPPLKLGRSTSSASGNSESTKRGPSPNPMGSFMGGFSVGPTSPGLQQFQSQPPQAPAPYRDHISTAQLSRIRDQGTGQYPSPADSNIDSPPLPLPNTTNMPVSGHHHSLSNPEMPPPFQISSFSFQSQPDQGAVSGHSFGDHRLKKRRLGSSLDRIDMYPNNQSIQPPNQFASTNSLYNTNSLSVAPMVSPPNAIRYQSSSPSNNGVRIPPTPAASVGSDDNYNPIQGPSPQPPSQESPDFRRLSVKSLLSDDSPAESTSGSEGIFPGKLDVTNFHNSQKTKYGVDRGFPDLDLPRNQDAIAVNGSTPNLDFANLANPENDLTNDLFSGFGFGLNNADGFQEGAGYYAKPVIVSISRSLEPLPDTLRSNPMNLLYFHHFLNHTARILVPHDCSANPFKSILPQSELPFAGFYICADSTQWLYRTQTF